MKTIATLCSGAGLVESGAIEAGFLPIWGIEIDNAIADIHKLNFPKSTIYDWDLSKQIPSEKWASLPVPDVLHISPPCQSFSQANKRRMELSGDIAIALSICRAIESILPEIITIENVTAYANSNSWALVAATLFKNNYYFTCGNFLMSDWGVPQDRTRFIVVATRDRLPPGIMPTHETVDIWDAIADLIPSLQISSLTQNQRDRIIDSDWKRIDSGATAVIQRVGIRDITKVRFADEYSFTITAGLGSDGKCANRTQFMNLAHEGKIYSLSVRAIARLMSVPDWYKLTPFPNKITLKGLGNGVCPKFYQQLLIPFSTSSI